MPPRERLKNLVNKAIPCFAKRAPGKFWIPTHRAIFADGSFTKLTTAPYFRACLQVFFARWMAHPLLLVIRCRYKGTKKSKELWSL